MMANGPDGLPLVTVEVTIEGNGEAAALLVPGGRLEQIEHQVPVDRLAPDVPTIRTARASRVAAVCGQPEAVGKRTAERPAAWLPAAHPLRAVLAAQARASSQVEPPRPLATARRAKRRKPLPRGRSGRCGVGA